MKKKVELLAPAGSFEVFKAVINAGADAVYLAGNMFGARAYAGNLTEEELIEAIEYSKIHGKRLYLTVNTLLKNEELKGQLYNYLKPLYCVGLDGVIVQDYGVVKFIHDNFPDMEIHASTQMTITDIGYLDLLKKYGVSRMVPARELSIEEIKYLHENTSMELETFIHGALCYCYSGQCLLSSFIGGRSGNRGRCAQPCRLEFENEDSYKSNKIVKPLSLKDLETLEILPQIIDAGVYSLKIEGRMKSAAYAAGITSIYRKYIDLYFSGKPYRVDERDIDKMLLLFDRGGISNGYYKKYNGKDMIAEENKSDKQLSEKKQLEDGITKSYVSEDIKRKINCAATFIKGEKAVLSLYDEQNYVTIEGDVVETAINRATTARDIEKQFGKLGNTPFCLEEAEIIMDENIFVPVKSVNELRRRAVAKLREEMMKPYRRHCTVQKFEEPAVVPDDKKVCQGISIRVMTVEQLRTSVKYNPERIIIDVELISAEDILNGIKLAHKNNIKAYIGMPRIDRKIKNEFIENNIDKWQEADGIMIRNISQFHFLMLNNFKGKIIADYNCYAFNDFSVEVLKEFGLDGLTYPVELNEKEMAGLNIYNGELLVYGRIPLMISANCVDKTGDNCHKPKGGFTYLRDRKNMRLPVCTCCRFCYNIIYNNVPLYLVDKINTTRIRPSFLGLSFTDESGTETEKILKEITDTMINNIILKPKENSFTRGHFARGVE